MAIWAGYNRYTGDLIVTGDTPDEVYRKAWAAGFDEEDVIVGRVTP